MSYKHRKIRSVLQGVSLCVHHSLPWSKASAFQSPGSWLLFRKCCIVPCPSPPGQTSSQFPTVLHRNMGVPGALLPRAHPAQSPSTFLLILVFFLPSLSSLAICKCHNNVCIPIAPESYRSPVGVGTSVILLSKCGP